jgi:predicted NUDIX family NTP pyrophosphohydrolase
MKYYFLQQEYLLIDVVISFWLGPLWQRREEGEWSHQDSSLLDMTTGKPPRDIKQTQGILVEEVNKIHTGKITDILYRI